MKPFLHSVLTSKTEFKKGKTIEMKYSHGFKGLLKFSIQAKPQE